MKRLAGISLIAALVLPLTSAHAAAPGNDAQADAVQLVLGSQTLIGDTSEATVEAGELESPCGALQNTVWYKLPAQRAGLTLDAGGHAFAVYALSGGQFGTAPVACTGPGEGSRQFLINNTGTAVAHLIQIGNTAGNAGPFSLQITHHAQPSNDNKANATVIPFGDGTYQVDSYAATNEPGEPGVTCNPAAQASVWFKFTPATTGTISFSTLGSDYDTVAMVHRVTTGTKQDPVGCNDNLDRELGLHSHLALTVRAGSTYLLQIATRGSGTNLAGIRGGNLVVTASVNGNDSLAQAAFFDGIGTFAGSTVGANSEATDADLPCATTGGPSIWFQVSAQQANEALAIASDDAEIAVFHPSGALVACSNGAGGVTIPHVNRQAAGSWVFNAILVRVSTDVAKPVSLKVFKGAFLGANAGAASARVVLDTDARSAAGSRVCVGNTCQGA